MGVCAGSVLLASSAMVPLSGTSLSVRGNVLQVRIAGPRGETFWSAAASKATLCLAAYSRKAQNDIKAGGGLLRRRREGAKAFAYSGSRLDVVHWLSMRKPNVLEASACGKGNPETCGARGIRIGWNVYLIGEFQTRRAGAGCARLRGQSCGLRGRQLTATSAKTRIDVNTNGSVS